VGGFSVDASRLFHLYYGVDYFVHGVLMGLRL
jgi:hypothetical protein